MGRDFFSGTGLAIHRKSTQTPPAGFVIKFQIIINRLHYQQDDGFSGPVKGKIISNKLQEWTDSNIKTILKPLKENLEEDIKDNYLRSIIYNLFNCLGTMPIDDFVEDLKKLTVENKKIISKLGIRIGVKFFFDLPSI